VNYFKKLRIRIGAFLLKQKLKKQKRTPIICNINQAKTIGLIFNCTIDADRQTVRDLESFFRQSNKTVEVLGYSNVKKNGDPLIGDANHHYIYCNDFNWFFKPKNELIDNFISNQYDILIDLYQDEEFPVEYMLKLSRAKFKVGCAHLDKGLHDLMIDVSKKKGDSSYLSEHLKHYLSILNN